MGNPSVEDILNMKSNQLKEFLEDHHVPVPKRQSKEFLQTVALQTHADREAESSKSRIITRRRSKREETDQGSTYSGIHGRSSPPSSRSTITTRSRAQSFIKTEAESPDRKEEGEDAAIAAAHSRHEQEEGLSYSSYSALLQAAPPGSTAPHILNSIDFNQQTDNAGDRQQAATPPFKQTHEEIAHHESAEKAKVSMKAHQASPDMTVPELEIIKESVKASGELQETNKKQSRQNQEVVKKIIRVNDIDADHQQEKNKGNSWAKKHSSHREVHLKGHHGQDNNGLPVSRMQRLKRSGSMIMSQVNERVIKRLRKVPNCRLQLARPRPHVSVALLMCATMCVAAIGAAFYWHHLKKLEEQRARKRWLW